MKLVKFESESLTMYFNMKYIRIASDKSLNVHYSDKIGANFPVVDSLAVIVDKLNNAFEVLDKWVIVDTLGIYTPDIIRVTDDGDYIWMHTIHTSAPIHLHIAMNDLLEAMQCDQTLQMK